MEITNERLMGRAFASDYIAKFVFNYIRSHVVTTPLNSGELVEEIKSSSFYIDLVSAGETESHEFSAGINEAICSFLETASVQSS